MVAFRRRRGRANNSRQSEPDSEGNKTGEISLKPAFKTLTLRVVAIIIYMCLGALVFCAIEYKDQDKTLRRRKVHIMRLSFMTKYNISEQELRDYEYAVQEMHIEDRDRLHEWSYYQSLYFVSTVTTTIGYGHLTPQTQAGRLFLIVFAVVGIPLNILALATVGEHITIGICFGISRLSRICCKKRTVRHINIKVMIVSITLMVFMLFIGGALYTSTEKWTYIDSIYYCFVALATIGFGDLVPNDGKPPSTSFGKALWGLRVLYISIGLSLVSTVFTAISNAIEEINALLGWPKKDDKEQPRKLSRRDSDNMPGLKGRTLKLPNQLTYRTTVDEMHDNLASALPMPGFRRNSSPSNDSRTATTKIVGATSFGVDDGRIDLANNLGNTSDHGSMKRRRSEQMERGFGGRLSRISMKSNDSAEELAIDYDMTNHGTVFDATDKTEFGGKTHICNGTAVGTAIQMIDISTDSDNYVKTIEIRQRLSREAKSIKSSENDGYESSHCTPSKRNLLHETRQIQDILDIEAQISDFAYCSPKRRKYVYREGHVPPGYSSHKRHSDKEAQLKQYTLQSNCRHMSKRGQSFLDNGHTERFDYGCFRNSLQNR